MSSKKDDDCLKDAFRKLFSNFFAMLSGDSYFLLQAEFDELDISTPLNKAVYFANDVSAKQREDFLSKNPDCVSLWDTPAGKKLSIMIKDFAHSKEDEGGLPDFSFDDLKRLKIFLAEKFAKNASGNFKIIYNNPKINDEVLNSIVHALYDNSAVLSINGNPTQFGLKPFFKNIIGTTDHKSSVTSLDAWREKQKKPNVG